MGSKLDFNLNIYTAKKFNEEILSSSSFSVSLTPTIRNLHQIEALSHCAFLDIFTPPYSEDRVCQYFKEIPPKEIHQLASKNEELNVLNNHFVLLKSIPEPSNFICLTTLKSLYFNSDEEI